MRTFCGVSLSRTLAPILPLLVESKYPHKKACAVKKWSGDLFLVWLTADLAAAASCQLLAAMERGCE